MKPETVKRLIDEGKSSQEIMILLQQDDLLHNWIEKIQRKSIELEQSYKDDKAALYEELIKIQKECPHFETEFCPDASGGRDSYRRCLLCLKEGSL